jgi:tetratricopeptide (TPR) repeat protein
MRSNHAAEIAAARTPIAVSFRSASGRWTAGTLIVLMSWPVASRAADDAASLRTLADAARTTLAERIEPPASRIPFLCTLGRTETAPIREYILRQQAAAIDALVASASGPDEARRVRRMLGELERDGYSRSADAYLADTAPGGAAGLRLAASLGELPAALHERLRPGGRCGNSYFGLVGRTLQPLGALARTDYGRLAELEPQDPWHTLVLGWLTGVQGEPALQRTLTVAQSLPDAESARVQIFAWQQLAWLYRDQGRAAEAQQAATQALRKAEEIVRRSGADLAQPAAELALRDAAQTGSTFAMALEDAGQKTAAFEVFLKVLSQQRRLTERRPDDVLAQLALIDTLGQLTILRDAAAPTGAPKKLYLDEATALYRKLEQRTPYSPMLDRSAWAGMFMTAAVAASGLTLIGGWVLLRRYRRRIAQLMMASARKNAAPPPAGNETLTQPAAPLAPTAGDATTAIAQAAAARRRAVFVQVGAGLAFGVAAAWLQLRADDTEPNLLNMALITWSWAWPTVLALGLIWDGDRRRRRLAWAAYLAGLLLICTIIALRDTPPMQVFGVTLPAFFRGLLFWVLNLSFSPLLLLFLNRAVRSIGPALLAMMLVAMIGGTLALVAASTPAGMAAGASVLGALSLPAGAMHPLVVLAGAVAAAPLAWWLGRRLRAAYAAKWLSDTSLVIDTLWGFQAVLLAFDLIRSIGPAGWLGLGVFALHKGITVAGMAPAARAARQRMPLRLLLLRVFTRRDRKGRVKSRRADAERLFDVLGSRWRYAGPIAMIGAPDLASSTIDPDEFLDFLAGKLRDRFIVEPGEVPVRLAAIDDRCDLDARWRVTELFCGNDAWRAAVLGLMARSDLVAMDLRDFGPDNQGCIFELQSLIDLVPAGRVALLVDGTTDRNFLQTTIDDCLARVPPTSPNARAGVRLALIDVGRGEQVSVDELLRMAALSS